MRFLCSENGIITQNSLIKVILFDLKTLPIIQSGQGVCKFLVHDGSHLIVSEFQHYEKIGKWEIFLLDMYRDFFALTTS